MDDKDINEIEIETDSGSYSHKDDKLSFRSIILTHFKNCILEGSKEMVMGGVQRRYVNDELIESIVPNQIEIFINHVDSLQTALSADLEIDKDTVKAINKIEENKDALKKKYNKAMDRIRKQYNGFSDVKNPSISNSLSEKQMFTPRFNKMMKRLNDVFIKRKLEMYKEILLPILTKLVSLKYRDG